MTACGEPENGDFVGSDFPFFGIGTDGADSTQDILLRSREAVGRSAVMYNKGMKTHIVELCGNKTALVFSKMCIPAAGHYDNCTECFAF